MLSYEFLYIISVPIYIVLLIFLLFKKVIIKRIIFISLFYFYIISLLAVTLFPIPIQGLKDILIYGGNNNFVPFVSIVDILFNDNLATFIKIKQVIGNIVLFIPMGFLIPFIYKNKVKNILFLGILLSFSIELTQYIISLILGFSYKITDIDDIILNILGFIIGLLLYKLFKKLL